VGKAKAGKILEYMKLWMWVDSEFDL
jgi:hypothetical protein